jgi:(R)-2-hydroxyacyl-CoA dehydratese activating ATPase
MIVVGCDVGSLFTKAAVLEDDRLVGSAVRRTTGNAVDEVSAVIGEALTTSGHARDRVDVLVSTGEGAAYVPGADYTESEVHCVAAAAAFFSRDVDLAIHCGGQSIASLLMNAEGEVVQFMRNDKCASGSGRFLEMIARKVGVPIEGLDEAAARATRPVPLSTQCGVFAESEIISHLNDGAATADVIAGICQAVGALVVAQGRRFRSAKQYTVTGGVARYGAVVDVIRDRLDAVYEPFPHDPIFAAAIGAAILGGGDGDE